MKKGFTLAEALITMAIIGIIMTLSIPAVIQSTNDTKPLFKKAFSTVEDIVNELINDVSIFPTGQFTNNSFCNNFFTKLNTIGYDYTTNTCANTYAGIKIPTGTGTVNVPNAVTSNAMEWYNFQKDFTAAQCPVELVSMECVSVSVDVNGNNKGADINTAGRANRDIFTIYITRTGKVYEPTTSDEGVILRSN